jgi:putative heme-binding domain-containing protein
MHSIADYIHWAGGDWTTSRGNKPEHSDAGGGHAHVGCMVYLGDNFPDEYRNTLFTCNLHGNRLNRDLLKRQGSGYKAERAPDFLFANDPWFRGIAIKSGPDGGVFVSDWCDTGECHNYDKVDLTNGRIHKVTYGTPKAWKGDLSKLSIDELAKLQTQKNDWFARHARRLLFERFESAGRKDLIVNAIRRVQRLAGTDVAALLRCAWLTTEMGEYREIDHLTEVLHRDLSVQAWAVRLYVEAAVAGHAPHLKPESPEFSCPTARDRLAFASAITRIPLDRRTPWALRLTSIVDARDAADANIPLMTWYAIEPLVGSDISQTRALLRAAKLPLVRQFIARKITALDPANAGMALAWAVESNDFTVPRDMLQGIIDGLGGAREVAAPSEWLSAGPKLLASRDRQVRERAMDLAATYGDEKAIDSMKQALMDTSADAAVRSTALRILLRRGKPDLLPILQQLVDDKALRAEAIRGLAAFDDKQTPGLLLKTYPTLSDAEKQDAVQTLASRPAWAMALLDAIESGSVPRKDVSAFVARQMQGLKDKRVGDRLAKVWGTIQPASARRAELTAKYKAILTDDAMAKADKSHGRLMFMKNCASCHKLYDDGGDVGPGLTGSQRSNLDYLLENVLDPSAVVPNEYKMSILQLQNGRTINGIITHETDKALTVRTANESIVVPKDEIETRTASKLSLMPEGILEKLTDTEVRDLIAYLRGREQVALPKGASK